MKVTGTFQIKKTSIYPCPPLPVLHSPARKMKSDPKHRDWRVNPMARMTQHQQQQNRVTSSRGESPSHNSDQFASQCSEHFDSQSSDKFGESPQPSCSYSQQQNTPSITLEKRKFNGVRKIQYSSMNMKFANLTMALNTAYQKSQEQAEKRMKMEHSLKEKSDQVMSC